MAHKDAHNHSVALSQCAPLDNSLPPVDSLLLDAFFTNFARLVFPFASFACFVFLVFLCFIVRIMFVLAFFQCLSTFESKFLC